MKLFYKMAAYKGDIISCTECANMLTNCDGIDNNSEEAAYYAKKAADGGNSDTMNFLLIKKKHFVI